MKQRILMTGFLFSIMLLMVCSHPISEFETVQRQPVIDPDYRDILVPPNIAPLNFRIKEDGQAAKVVLSARNERVESVEIYSSSKEIRFPMKKWKRFLNACRGQEWFIDVFLRTEEGWEKYDSIINKVANQTIDSHVAYRLINPGYVLWWQMGIYQRDITTFKQRPIFENRMTKKNCMNCHSFCLNDPNRMMYHMRSHFGGTMLIQDGTVTKINTGTDYTMSAGVYPAWHPGGKHIAFSVNKIYQNFHSHHEKSIHVYDTASDLVIYDIEKNQITTSPKVSTGRMENLPSWSPDGKELYFISAPPLEKVTKYQTVKYDLMHMTYDVETNEWGEVTPLLTASEAGQSLTFPKVSPTGRYLMFTMSDYGYFTIHGKSSNLWLYDLEENSYHALNVNSDHVDSYHSWSSDGHWFVFSSKRKNGVCTRLYFSFVDENGNASKPFLLPQKDPGYYDTFLLNYNVPELITGPVNTGHWKLLQHALADPVSAAFDTTVNVDALSGASRILPEANSRPYN